jgi:RNA polymerase sigma-70 factor (ECF subfamily)
VLSARATLSSARVHASTEEASLSLVPARLTFEEVYERHLRFVWRVLRASGLPEALVEDAVQDVFMVVHRRLPEFEYRSDIRTWLFRIARWVISGERKRLKRTPQHDPVDDEVREQVRDAAAGPHEQATRREALRTLERILNQMDPDKRIAFLLMDIEEMKATEVAELLEISVNTASSRLRLAREQFKKLLAESLKGTSS